MGRVFSGWIPAAAVYSANFPICEDISIRAQANYYGEAYRDPNAIDTKIAKTQDTRTICDDADRRLGIGPIAKYGGNGLALLDRDVQSLGARIQRRVLEAHISNRGRVYKGHHLSDIVDQEAVEEVNVLGFKSGEVEVFVDVCGSAIDHAQSSHALRLKAL